MQGFIDPRNHVVRHGACTQHISNHRTGTDSRLFLTREHLKMTAILIIWGFALGVGLAILGGA